MSCSSRSTRYAHSEGHTDLAYSDSGRYLLTCGSDGDVRIWDREEDDDPVSHRVAEVVYSVLCQNDRFYTAGDDNSIRAHLLKDGQADGLLLRFTAHATHMCFNKSGSMIYAGSSDFTIKTLEISSSKQRNLQGHEAPILSLSLHPNEDKLASSSCDGTIGLWDLKEYKPIHTIPVVPQSNDFGLSPTLCRLTWSKDGNHLFVPVGQEIFAYSSNSWTKAFILNDVTITTMISIVAVSPCGQYIAGSCKDGLIIIWNIQTKTVVCSEPHEKKLCITALAWNPKDNNELAYCDELGTLGFFEDIIPPTAKKSQLINQSIESFNDLFDDEDEDIMQINEVEGGGEGLATNANNSDDDDNDGLSMAKKSRNFIEDENSQDTILSTDSKQNTDLIPVASVTPQVRGPPLTPIQDPFQPSSTPLHLSHRFMVWNSVGLIKQYNTEEENSIDIEFHDTAIHHAIHVNNAYNHTMAVMSPEAVVLASESDDDSISKLQCMHFSSWDICKEWMVSMPENEEIKAVTLGEGWIAVVTDTNTVRIFTVGGVQKQIFNLSGPVVAMAGHTSQLFIVYHNGPGLPGDQNLSVLLLQITGKTKCIIQGDRLPISSKSTLEWMGFTAEGTPVIYDSNGILLMFNRKFAQTWTQISNLKSQCKSKSDHYFIVGLQENPAQIRCILCKGNKFPQMLPRPSVIILKYQLPYCEMNTEKGQLEESFWRSKLLTNYLDFWDVEGYEVDEDMKTKAMMPQQESLMKLFALSSKTEKEFRAVEFCEMMPDASTVQLAMKYASRLRMLQLAQRLSELAQNKMEENDEDSEDPNDMYSWNANNRNKLNNARVVQQENGSNQEAEEEEEEEEDVEMDMNEDEIDDDDIENNNKGPMIKTKSNADKLPPQIISISQGAQKKNPFKVGSQNSFTNSVKGSVFFDGLKNKSIKESESITIKPKEISKKITLSNPLGKKMTTQSKPAKNKKPGKSTKTGFSIWLEEHKAQLIEENPNMDDGELAILAATRFKGLSVEDKQMWNDKVKENVDDQRKRKRDESEQNSISNFFGNNLNSNIKKKSVSETTGSKLSNFAFDKS